jgi:hypothetical protein
MRTPVRRMTVAVMMKGDVAVGERTCSSRLIQAAHIRAAYPLTEISAKT